MLFLKFCIACSTALAQWLCGSTNCSFIFSSSRYCLTAFEATLYMMLNTGLKPLFVRYLMFSFNIAIVEISVRSFTGIANIKFYDQLYSTKIAVLPFLDLIRNFNV